MPQNLTFSLFSGHEQLSDSRKADLAIIATMAAVTFMMAIIFLY